MRLTRTGLAVVSVALWALGCSASGLCLDPTLDPRWYAIEQAPDGPLPGPSARDPMLEALQSPVIDIHSHSFNARYLPLYDILLGKRDVSFWGLFVSDGWARAIAGAVVKTAQTACAPDDGQVRLPGELSRELAAELDLSLDDVRSNTCVQSLFSLCERLDTERLTRGV